jgi:hypothetical protein
MQKIEELTSEATVFQLLRNSGQWGVCPENTKEKFSSSSLRQNGGRWRREIIMPWKGLKNLGIGTWVGHSFRESSLGRPYRVPFQAGMFLPWTPSWRVECHPLVERRGVGLRRRVRSPLWRSVSVSVGNRGFGQVKGERERERERGGRRRRRAAWLPRSFARSCLVLLVLLRVLELFLLLLRLGTNSGLLSFLFVSVKFSPGFCFCFLPLSSLVSVTTFFFFFEFVKTATREFSGILIYFYF